MGGREVDGVVHRLTERRLRQAPPPARPGRPRPPRARRRRRRRSPAPLLRAAPRPAPRPPPRPPAPAPRYAPAADSSSSSSSTSTGIDTITGPVGVGLRQQEGAADQRRQILHLAHLDRVLEGALGERQQVAAQHRVLDQVAAVLLPDGDHHRRAGAPGVEHVRQAVGEPGGDVQVEERRAAGGPGVPVGHRDRGPLVQAEVVVELRHLGELVHEGQLGGSRVAEDAIDALALGQLDQSPRGLTPTRSGSGPAGSSPWSSGGR